MLLQVDQNHISAPGAAAARHRKGGEAIVALGEDKQGLNHAAGDRDQMAVGRALRGPPTRAVTEAAGPKPFSTSKSSGTSPSG